MSSGHLQCNLHLPTFSWVTNRLLTLLTTYSACSLYTTGIFWNTNSPNRWTMEILYILKHLLLFLAAELWSAMVLCIFYHIFKAAGSLFFVTQKLARSSHRACIWAKLCCANVKISVCNSHQLRGLFTVRENKSCLRKIDSCKS